VELWTGVCNDADQAGEDKLSAALEKEPELTKLIARRGADSFRKWIDTLPEGTNALVVGHSPFLELIAYGLFEVIMPQLEPCEGFRIVEKENKLSFEPLLRLSQKS
jgi:hypothetical protein